METHRVRFGEFEADLATGELRRSDATVSIQDLPFRLLAALLERAGRAGHARGADRTPVDAIAAALAPEADFFDYRRPLNSR